MVDLPEPFGPNSMVRGLNSSLVDENPLKLVISNLRNISLAYTSDFEKSIGSRAIHSVDM
jgi:hypothetical protein